MDQEFSHTVDILRGGQGRIQTVATVAAATVRFPEMQTSLKSSVSWNTVVLRIFFSEGIVSIHDLIHVDEMFCHSLRQLVTRSLMLMAQSFFWLSPSSVITTSIGSGLMITSQIEREKTVGGSVLNTPWLLSGVPHATTRRELRHL